MGNLNHTSTSLLATSDQTDLCVSPTGGNSIPNSHHRLSWIILPEFICVNFDKWPLFASTKAQGMFSVCFSFTSWNIPYLSLPPWFYTLLSPSFFQNSLKRIFLLLFWTFPIYNVTIFTEVVDTIFGVCCPLQIYFIANFRISSLLLKSIRKRRSSFTNLVRIRRYKSSPRWQIGEIKHTDITFARQLLNGNKSRSPRQGIWLLC